MPHPRAFHALRFPQMACVVTLACAPDAVLAQRQSRWSATVPVVGQRVHLTPAGGAHIGPAQRVFVSAGVMIEADSARGCSRSPDPCSAEGRFVGLLLASPGLDGMRLSAGGGFLGEPLTGLTGTLSVLRTWRAPIQVDANQTFIGPGVNLVLTGMNVGFVSYWRVAGRAPWEDWFATISFGVGL